MRSSATTRRRAASRRTSGKGCSRRPTKHTKKRLPRCRPSPNPNPYPYPNPYPNPNPNPYPYPNPNNPNPNPSPNPNPKQAQLQAQLQVQMQAVEHARGSNTHTEGARSWREGEVTYGSEGREGGNCGAAGRAGAGSSAEAEAAAGGARAQLLSLRGGAAALRAEHTALAAHVRTVLSAGAREAEELGLAFGSRLAETQAELVRVAAERRAAADKLQEVQGAIRVLVRCRPLSRAELGAGGGSAVAVPSTPTPTPTPSPAPSPSLTPTP